MTTITQTLETLTFTARAPKQNREPKPESGSFCPPGCSCQAIKSECSPDCSLKTVCPPGCPCKTRSFKTSQLICYAAGIFIAILASYLIISTNSKLYLVFWVVYSVLRRMMMKSKKISLKAKTD